MRMSQNKTTSDRSQLQLELDSNNTSHLSGDTSVVIQQPATLRSPASPIGEGLVGLKYIDDVGSREDLLDDRRPRDEEEPLLCLTDSINQPITAQQPDTTAIVSPPVAGGVPVCPPGLQSLLEEGQVVVHLGNLRQNLVVNDNALARMEVINETRHVLFHVEQEEKLNDTDSDKSFFFRFYGRDRQEVMQVYSPHTQSCVCCGASWHCLKSCTFQAIIYAPPGVVIGFLRRSHTRYVQEYQILNAQEEAVLTLRGGGQDLEIFSLDLDSELGRISVHRWVGIMHEVRRTAKDWGLTFPVDLDIHVKASLVGAVFAINWLLSTKGGKRK